MKTSLQLFAVFILGLILGYYELAPEFLINNGLVEYVLYVMLFFVGVSMGQDKKAWGVVRKLKAKIFLVPAGTVLGTFIGAVVVNTLIKDLRFIEVVTVAAGMGYYSLPSVILNQLGFEVLGVLALLTNLFRETITLLTTPILAKYFGKLSPIAAGGATTSDVTLPVIVEFTGKQYGVIAIFNGVVITILVPFMVTALASLL